MTDDQEQTIVVRVPPQRLRWLAAELRNAGLQFEVERAGDVYHVQTTAAAAPQLRKVLTPAPRPDARRPWWAGLGRLVAVLVLLTAGAWVVLQLASGMMGVEGMNMSFMRAAAVLVIGVISAFSIAAWIGKPPGGMPDTRWQLVLGLVSLAIAAAAAVVAGGAMR